MDYGWLLHMLGGLGVSVLLPGPTTPLLLFSFGLGRELWQHDGEMNPHRWWEAVCWPLGWVVLQVPLWVRVLLA